MDNDGGDRGEGDSAAGARETRRQGRGRLGGRGEGDSTTGARERLERVVADRISLFYDIVILRMRRI